MFHWNHGWYFSRLPDGSVEVRNHGDFNGHSPNCAPGDGRTTLVIPAEQWASIVCSVSAGGEGDGRWNAALDFHGRLDQYVTVDQPDFLIEVADERSRAFHWTRRRPNYPKGWLDEHGNVYVIVRNDGKFKVEWADPSGDEGFFGNDTLYASRDDAATAGIRAYDEAEEGLMHSSLSR